MTWLEGNSCNPKPAGERLREFLARPKILRSPGAHNAMAGLLAKEQGFEDYLNGLTAAADIEINRLKAAIEEFSGRIKEMLDTSLG